MNEDTSMGNKNLKELARSYSRREISTSEYRRLRSELLDDLTSAITNSNTSPESNSVASNDEQIPPSNAQDNISKPENRIFSTLIQVCLLIALILGFFYFFK